MTESRISVSRATFLVSFQACVLYSYCSIMQLRHPCYKVCAKAKQILLFKEIIVVDLVPEVDIFMPSDSYPKWEKECTDPPAEDFSNPFITEWAPSQILLLSWSWYNHSGYLCPLQQLHHQPHYWPCCKEVLVRWSVGIFVVVVSYCFRRELLGKLFLKSQHWPSPFELGDFLFEISRLT